jgi:hypothetical protein
MSTTQTYLHLAGVVFPDEAKRLEQRFAVSGSSSTAESEVSTALSGSVAELGTDLREPEST